MKPRHGGVFSLKIELCHFLSCSSLSIVARPRDEILASCICLRSMVSASRRSLTWTKKGSSEAGHGATTKLGRHLLTAVFLNLGQIPQGLADPGLWLYRMTKSASPAQGLILPVCCSRKGKLCRCLLQKHSSQSSIISGSRMSCKDSRPSVLFQIQAKVLS